MKKSFGILGGMGPQATCELYRLINDKVCKGVTSSKNADFPHLLINNVPVPDLIGDRDSEERAVALARDGALALERAGATDVLMPCNTMHVFQEAITERLGARFHSLIDVVAKAMKGSRKVLLLGSRTTIETGLYQKALEREGIPYKNPSPTLCDHSVKTILATISQSISPAAVSAFVDNVLEEARKDDEVDTIGLVCTELPLVFPLTLEGFRIVSSLNEAAEHIVALHLAV